MSRGHISLKSPMTHYMQGKAGALWLGISGTSQFGPNLGFGPIT